MRNKLVRLAVFLIAFVSAAAVADDVTRIPAPGGEIVFANAGDRALYEQYTFAPARRAGDFVYLCGER